MAPKKMLLLYQYQRVVGINGHTKVCRISKKVSVIVSMLILKARTYLYQANHFILKYKLI